ncbi:MAG: chemotaxis protein CheB [Melioribacteraceae bacterium]|nr:chemotaxis protein CheB [Melioribacteraceae bacterium]
MKILIVDDNVSNRIVLRKILRKAEYDIVEAEDGVEALKQLGKHRFDAVLTDWLMPQLDGLELVYHIRRKIKPVPVLLVVTALVSPEARNKALNSGADDYIAKPFDKDDILERLENAIKLSKIDKTIESIEVSPNVKPPNFVGVCFAASTGGPPALFEVFSKFEATDKAAFFIVLHGPVWMLESFTERLQKIQTLSFKVAENGMPIEPGNVYVCPGERHMVIKEKPLIIELLDTPPINFVKPAADPLFQSAAHVFQNKCIGVVLTGMGKDGTLGAGYISTVGGTVVVQNPTTAVLPSMPQSVINLNLANIISPLDKIASNVLKVVNLKY